jgi:O-antigen ligase
MTTASSALRSLSLDRNFDRAHGWSPSVAAGAGLLAAAVFFLNANLRAHVDGESFSVDFEDLLRLAICGGCGLYGLAKLPRTFACFANSAGFWGLLFCAWATLTVPMAESMVHSTASCLALWCLLLFAPAALSELGGWRATLTILATLVVYLIASWLAYFFYPELGASEFRLSSQEIKYRVGGLGGAQQLGLMAAWTIGCSLLLRSEGGVRWRSVLGPIALALFTLPFTESRTAMLVAAAIGLLFAWRRLSHALVLVGGCAALVVACTTLLLFQSGLLKVEASGLDSALEKVSRSGKIEEIYNLTGRTEVWEFVADQIARSPLIGYGYGCSRYVLARYPGSASDDFQPLHAHNLWLDVAVTTGLIGVLLYAAMIAQQAVGFVRRPAAFPDMALLLVLVAGNTEPVLFGAMPKTHTVLWMIALVWRGLAASVAPGAADAEGEGV